ncbi:glycoside hydrolase family 27 protein [Hebeloma cylindrosporum]|uniref:Alpha-galactosidase n=1 Tax=Hebeloma cylindrosporum TaxID=76867 RepID=A0A0C3C0L5_HEBCY|nr:glycoside hydrolase family 27 protein [Hebeloma cylindrosporum h7]
MEHHSEPRYAPLEQDEAGSSRERLVTDHEFRKSNPGLPYMEAPGELEVGKKKWYKKRLTLIFTPFTVIMTVGFIVLAALLGTWVAQGKAANSVHLAEVGRLPFMGYNTWNEYHCNINESVILETARLIKSHGLLDHGYNYVSVDDCYSEKTRDLNGNIVASKERFPSGMKHLTDTIHSLGMKAGIYSDSGWFTCELYPGSYMNEERDIKLFQEEWGFDLLKYDNCAVPFDEIIKEGMVGKYTRMSNAIKKQSQLSGKPPILFSLCQWGRVQPWLWARQLGQSWRSTGDIYPEWISVAGIINENSFISWATDFYGRNDLDMLEIGHSKLTYDEQKSHFTAWAFMKSPLLIGTDMSEITDEALSILKNAEIIAINQDPVVGTAITPFRWGINPDWTFNRTHPAQYWSGKSENGTIIMLLNTLEEPADMTFRLVESPWIRAGRQYTVRDLWTHTDNGTAVRSFTAKDVPRHGVVALLLKDAGDEPVGTLPPCSTPEWCMDQNGTRIDQ